MNLPRKTINELRARLNREPTIREIYVEGLFDRDLFRWILNQLDIFDVRVYTISAINVPDELVLKLGLTIGERQRIQAVAHELEQDTHIHDQVAMVIDADQDYLLDRARYATPLIGTAGTCAEMLLWNDEVLHKFFSMALSCEDVEDAVKKTKEFVEPIVIAVCLFRAAKESLGENWILIDIEDTFDRKKQFSFEDYCVKVGHKNAAITAIKELLPPVLEAIDKRARDLNVLQKMHGHDLMGALARKLRIDGFTHHFLHDREELGRLLMASVEWVAVRNDLTVELLKNKFDKHASASE